MMHWTLMTRASALLAAQQQLPAEALPVTGARRTAMGPVLMARPTLTPVPASAAATGPVASRPARCCCRPASSPSSAAPLTAGASATTSGPT
jgi:hypothetical protein